MNEQLVTDVIEATEQEILTLAYNISKVIDLNRRRDDQIIAGQLCSLKRVLEDQSADYETRYQVIDALVAIGNLHL
jgi:hypothetical protein